MTENQDIKKKFLSGFKPEGYIAREQLRLKALRYFNKTDFPTLKHEDWRHTNIIPALQKNYLPADKVTESVEDISRFKIPGLDAVTIVFVNGKYIPELSENTDNPDNVIVSNLTNLDENSQSILESYFDSTGLARQNIFSALNTAFACDGSVIYIPENITTDKIIHIINISANNENAIITYPRNLIVANSNSHATIIESQVSLNDGITFSNTVTEIFLNENAHIDYSVFQKVNDKSFLIGTTNAIQKKDSSLKVNTITGSGRIVRNNMNIKLNEENANVSLNGLYLGNGKSHFDNHIEIKHEKPHCISNQLYKGVLDDESSAVFHGKVYVAEGAFKTDANQSNQNIILTKETKINSNPQLEIYNDDVRCTHGSTVGQLDPESLFYMQSRGIALNTAKIMLLNAFASEIAKNIKTEPFKRMVEQIVTESYNQTK